MHATIRRMPDRPSRITAQISPMPPRRYAWNSRKADSKLPPSWMRKPPAKSCTGHTCQRPRMSIGPSSGSNDTKDASPHRSPGPSTFLPTAPRSSYLQAVIPSSTLGARPAPRLRQHPLGVADPLSKWYPIEIGGALEVLTNPRRPILVEQFKLRRPFLTIDSRPPSRRFSVTCQTPRRSSLLAGTGSAGWRTVKMRRSLSHSGGQTHDPRFACHRYRWTGRCRNCVSPCRCASIQHYFAPSQAVGGPDSNCARSCGSAMTTA